MSITGSCLCGSVTFSTRTKPLSFQYCACESCRKTTGSAHASNLTVPVESLVWLSGEEKITKYTQKEKNPGFPTWFCSECGSFLPHISRSKRVYVVPAGLLDTKIEIKPTDVIYWGESPGWYRSTDSMPKHQTEPARADNLD